MLTSGAVRDGLFDVLAAFGVFTTEFDTLRSNVNEPMG